MADEGIIYETTPFRPRPKPQRARANGHDPDKLRKFQMEPWSAIAFAGGEEWAIKRFLPASGVAALYGKPGSLKSFLAMHVALSLALGREWAGRRVKQASVVYVAAEGAGGLRKRKAGYEISWLDMPANVPFHLISAAPNLGTAEQSDVDALANDIEAAGVAPGLIVIDTLAQSLGSGDENGSGMIVFAANAAALAKRFGALVLVVHHSGLSEGAQQRMRGHSSFNGALDAVILCERNEGDLAATLTLQKLKDEAASLRLTAQLSRVVVGHDEDGDEVSTLIVDGVQEAERETRDAKAPKRIPDSQRLLMSVIVQALLDAGVKIAPFGVEGPQVQAVEDEIVRAKYYIRIAEQAGPDEEPEKLAERQRKSFNRSVAEALKAERIVAAEIMGSRRLWLP